MEYATSSGSLAVGTNVIKTTGGAVTAVMLVGGSAASTVIVYESPDGTATGTVIASLSCAASTSVNLPLDAPVACNKQLVAVVAGTGATAVVHYLPR